jgi:hypothetical protein
MILLLLLAVLPSLLQTAWCQEWHSYQLTHFPAPASVQYCSSVADTFGHVHTYMVVNMLESAPPPYIRVYYVRTDFYGHVLTDTTWITNFVSPDSSYPGYARAVGDGHHSWCVFDEFIPGDIYHGVYLTERDENGEVVTPPVLVGRNNIGRDWADAVLDPLDRTIYLVGSQSAGTFDQFTTRGDSVRWHAPIDGMLDDRLSWSVIISPADRHPWVSMVTQNLAHTQGAFQVVRLGEDTSQVVYTALPGTSFGPGQQAFGMDASRNSDFWGGCDTARSAYVRLDSTFQTILEWRTLSRYNNRGTVKTDSSGNCLVLWSNTWYGLSWGYRRSDGAWPYGLNWIDQNMYVDFYSVITMQDQRFAFTIDGAPRGTDFTQVWLYTYGFPPDAAVEPQTTKQIGELAVHPNPFGSTFTVEIPNTLSKRLLLYDLLGRLVWSRDIPANAGQMVIRDPLLAMLPSGTYYLTLSENLRLGSAPLQSFPHGAVQITHFK